jgi:hypothetical protein
VETCSRWGGELGSRRWGVFFMKDGCSVATFALIFHVVEIDFRKK